MWEAEAGGPLSSRVRSKTVSHKTETAFAEAAFAEAAFASWEEEAEHGSDKMPEESC